MNDSIRPVNRSDVRHIDALPVGARLAEFEILALLGVGGFGMVYKAFDHSLHRTVAIKEYMPATLATRVEEGYLSARSTTDGPAFQAGLASFVEEARMLAQFDHPSLVKVFRFWEEKNTAYMVMPLYHGMTLKQARAHMRTPPPEAWLRKLLWSVLSALRVLHDANMLHRDISPENIFLQDFGPPVLLDLGASRYAINDNDTKHTVVLKINYAPIEQYSQGAGMGTEPLAQGPWSDLYSLAAMVHGCLCNDAPLPSTLRLMRDRLVPFARVAKTVEAQFGEAYSASFVNAIGKALKLQPEDRPQSIDAFLSLLGMFVPPAGMDHFDFRAQLGGIWVEPKDPTAVAAGTATSGADGLRTVADATTASGVAGVAGAHAHDAAKAQAPASAAPASAAPASAAPASAAPASAAPASSAAFYDGPATIFLEDERSAAREAFEPRAQATRVSAGAQVRRRKTSRPHSSESDRSPAMKRRRAALSATNVRKRKPWLWSALAVALVVGAAAVGVRINQAPAPATLATPAAVPVMVTDDILTEFKLPMSGDPQGASPDSASLVPAVEAGSTGAPSESTPKLASPSAARTTSAQPTARRKAATAPVSPPPPEPVVPVALPAAVPTPRPVAATAPVRTAPAATLLCADSGALTRSSCLRAECRSAEHRSNPACVEFRNAMEPFEKNQFAN